MEEKIKILIMEDDNSLADILEKKFTKEGYEVALSYDGDSGYKKILNWNPDLIMLDVELPKLNGYDILKKLKEDSIETPVIVISDSGELVEIEKAKQLGALDIIVKAEFDIKDIVAKAKACLEKKEDRKEDRREEEGKPEKKNGEQGIDVLLVEDDKFLRSICSKKLASEGFNVFEAVDGQQALQQVEEIKPDIVLLDIILPVIDGFGVLSEIRAHKNEKVKNTPVIILSNLGQDEDVKKATDLGANNYLIKAHFTTDEIVEKIKKEIPDKK